MTDERLITTISIVGIQAAAVVQLYDHVPIYYLAAFFFEGLMACWLAFNNGEHHGFKRGLKVMENLR